MNGFHANIEDLTKANDTFRKVLYTGHNLQLVLMTLQPGEEIGWEVHDDRDQFFRIEKGKGEIVIDDTVYQVAKEEAVIVPQGARHNVRCTGEKPLYLYTIYGPPEHIDGTIHATPAEAHASEEHFDGKTTE